MKNFLYLFALTLMIFSSPAFADVTLAHVQAFETSEGMRNGAVTLDITNNGPQEDKLVAVSTPAADAAELHVMTEHNGVMKMREVGGVPIKPGKTVSLSPSGYHIMLLGLKEPLEAGTAHPLILKFMRAGEMKTTFKVLSHSVVQSDHIDMDMDMAH